jgi:hypothetical protein
LLIEAGGGEVEVAEEEKSLLIDWVIDLLLRLLPSVSGETAKSDMI